MLRLGQNLGKETYLQWGDVFLVPVACDAPHDPKNGVKKCETEIELRFGCVEYPQSDRTPSQEHIQTHPYFGILGRW